MIDELLDFFNYCGVVYEEIDVKYLNLNYKFSYSESKEEICNDHCRRSCANNNLYMVEVKKCYMVSPTDNPYDYSLPIFISHNYLFTIHGKILITDKLTPRDIIDLVNKYTGSGLFSRSRHRVEEYINRKIRLEKLEEICN